VKSTAFFPNYVSEWLGLNIVVASFFIVSAICFAVSSLGGAT